MLLSLLTLVLDLLCQFLVYFDGAVPMLVIFDAFLVKDVELLPTVLEFLLQIILLLVKKDLILPIAPLHIQHDLLLHNRVLQQPLFLR